MYVSKMQLLKIEFLTFCGMIYMKGGDYMDSLNIGEKIKLLRKERDLSMDMLVSDINRLYDVKITKSMVSSWESDKNVPTLESMKCLVLYFNVSLDWFLGLTDKRTPPHLWKAGD